MASVAVALVAGVVGLSAVLAVQTKAKAEVTRALAGERYANQALAASNDELARSKAAVLARYDLAVEAIKAFHTGVSEDFLLKQDQFKDLRDRLLRSAQDFYGKLSALLGRETDPAARRALLASNFELADLTGKVGGKEDALTAHRAVLAAREALEAEPGADAAVTVDVGRSLIEIAGLLEATGKTGEALASYRRSESLLSGPAGTDPAARAALAACRSRLGEFLLNTSQTAEALAACRLARADQEALAAAPGVPAAAGSDLATTVYRIGSLLMRTGKLSEAEVEFRRALEIYAKLAADHPAVTQFRSRLALDHNSLGNLLAETGKPSEAETESRRALAILQKLAADNPKVPDHRDDVAGSHNNLSVILRRLGRSAEARDGSDEAIAIREALVREVPNVPVYRTHLAYSYFRRGLARGDLGEFAGAAVDARRAIALWEGLPSRTGQEWFEAACAHAALASLAGRAGSGVSGAEAVTEADAAMALLRRAVAQGHRRPDAYRTEDALGPLRFRDDFRLMMMDLAMPPDPFDRGD